jgi:hypothetical protein
MIGFTFLLIFELFEGLGSQVTCPNGYLRADLTVGQQCYASCEGIFWVGKEI